MSQPGSGGQQRDPRSGPFGFQLDIATRWLDNDQYGHVNNSAYYLVTDSIVNTYLITHCGITPFQHPDSSPSPSSAPSSSTSSALPAGLSAPILSTGPSSQTQNPGQDPGQDPRQQATATTDSPPPADSVIGLVISSGATYHAPTSFPSVLRVGMRVIHLGKSSVRYEVAIFEQARPVLSSPSSSSVSSSSQSQAPLLSTGSGPGTSGAAPASAQPQTQPLPREARAAVVTQMTHVFVDRVTRRPVRAMPVQLRAGLEKLRVPSVGSGSSSPVAKL